MDRRAYSDLFFLTDEKFDFDVTLSPASSKGDEDEDEVFVGPVSHTEKCVSVYVASRLEKVGGSGGGMRPNWSPLSGDQLEAMCQEAHSLADQLQCGGELSQPDGENAKTTTMTTDATTDRDDFVQDAESKLGVLDQTASALDQTASALSAIKRQTFCVQDSPMKQLPPAVQRRLLRGSSSNTASSTRSANTALSTRHSAVGTASSTRHSAVGTASSTRHSAVGTASFTRPANTTLSTRQSAVGAALSTRPAATARHGTSSPVVGVKPQPRTGLRRKSTLGVVLPSKPAAPTTSVCSTSKSRVEKPRMQPPSKVVGGWRQGPSSRPSSRAGSCEDLLSDSASMASDISDSSLNSSILGKRTMAPPTKGAARNLSGVKAPALQGRSVMERRNTSSSSSSVSSFNSSYSQSPAKGKLNSLNQSLSSSIGPTPSSISRPANHSRLRRSTVYTAAEPASTTAGRRSLSTQARKLSEVECVKAARSTPLKRAESTPLQMTPAKRVSERIASIPASASARSGFMNKSKPDALVLPTPSGGVGGVCQGDAPDVSKMLKPKRLSLVSSLDSLPQKPSAVPLTPSAGSCMSLQAKTRRPSALPTPVRRTMLSGIPIATPTRPPPTSQSDPASARRERGCSPAPTDSQEAEPVDITEIQPFCLEEEEDEPPAALPTSPPQPDQSESTDPGAPSQGESEPSRNLIELETIEESNSKTQEFLLLDLPAPTLQPQEKLLIDLTNTPVLIRTSSKTCTTTQQLIDLSSPLIRWSPEDKRENNAPLINLSF